MSDAALAVLGRWSRRIAFGLLAIAAVVLLTFVVTPGGRALALLNLGGLEMNRAFALPAQAAARPGVLADAENTLAEGLAQAPGNPAILRDLAWVRAARYDDSGGLSAVEQAADSPGVDAFDMLQIAHVYRDLGIVDQAYASASRAYTDWGRAPEDAVMQVYAQATLSDSRARTLADQGEAAMRARTFTQANTLFQQALTFEPDNAYLIDRIGASQRAVDKYGG
jgi:hypothetical protein